MKSSLAIVIAVLATQVALAAETQCPRAMPRVVEARLLPVLNALDQARKKNDFWDKRYEAAFLRLSRAKDNASAQARVALMDYYIGEAYGEGLVCTVALDGVRSKKWLELYEQCDILVSASTVERFHSLPLRGYALKIIGEGNAAQSCTYE